MLIASGQLEAEMYCDILQEEGIPATVQPRDSTFGISSFPCRVMVPEDMLEEARATLSNYLENQPEGL